MSVSASHTHTNCSNLAASSVVLLVPLAFRLLVGLLLPNGRLAALLPPSLVGILCYPVEALPLRLLRLQLPFLLHHPLLLLVHNEEQALDDQRQKGGEGARDDLHLEVLFVDERLDEEVAEREAADERFS